jgi:hypothetical protein
MHGKLCVDRIAFPWRGPKYPYEFMSLVLLDEVEPPQSVVYCREGSKGIAALSEPSIIEQILIQVLSDPEYPYWKNQWHKVRQLLQEAGMVRSERTLRRIRDRITKA